jgi:hypothetical protein
MKQFDTIEKKIGGYTFYIRPFPTFTSINLSADLAAFIGPMASGLVPLALGNGGGEDGEGGEDREGGNGFMDIDLAALVPSIAGALSSLEGDRLESIMKRLLCKSQNIAVEIEGEAETLTVDIFNEIFSGEAQEAFLLAAEVIMRNFNGLFRKLSRLFGSLGMGAKATKPKNTESSTQPGSAT